MKKMLALLASTALVTAMAASASAADPEAVLITEEESVCVMADSIVSAEGEACLSAEDTEYPYLYLYHTELDVLPDSMEGGNSGALVLGYDPETYGSGYGVSLKEGTRAYFYGTSVKGGSCAAVLAGGSGYFAGLIEGYEYEAVSDTGEKVFTYTAEENIPADLDAVFGILAQDSGSVVLAEGTVLHSQAAAFLYQDGDCTWTLDGAEVYPENGILLQMIDQDSADDLNSGDLNSAGTYRTEEAGFLQGISEEQEEPSGDSREVVLNLANGEYTGSVYNASGCHGRAADRVTVNISDSAVLNGDIALASYVHGIFLNTRAVDEVTAAIDAANAASEEELQYVFLDSDGLETREKEEAAALQFTGFSDAQAYLQGQVLNMVNYNGLSAADVNAEGVWNVESVSLVTSLNVAEGAQVYGEVIDLEDGSLLIIPSDTALPAGQYVSDVR